MSKEYCVYVHTNKANGKKYVGITSMIPERRWAGGRGYRNNCLFSRAIQKYGWNGFSHEIVESGLTRQEAYQKEIELIESMQLTDPKHGYNLDKGGNGSNRITEESRKKISDSVKRYMKEHPEVKAKCSQKMKQYMEEHPEIKDNLAKYRENHPEAAKAHGEWLSRYYKEHPEEVRKSRDKCREYYNAHPEARIEKSEQTKRYFEEHPEARAHNAKKTHEYYQRPEVKKWKSEERKRFFAEHPEKKTTKAVVQYALDGALIAEFLSAREASAATSVDYRGISATVTGKQKTAGGYIWRYRDENKAV